ncbi:helix-turn-helix domain-containing protein [Streptomyces sp. NPDC058280]|uniref:helix-turn-helix domain-containing protein n=1 Tax=Streptomyces sp. NPDC058280 TaxID=3346419 RepID=UPI0036EB1147
MGRRPGVLVRPVSMEEGRRSPRISRTAKDPVRLRRAIVLLMSVQGRTVKDITSLMRVGEDYVRDVIHAFNERGLDPLDPNRYGGVMHMLAALDLATSKIYYRIRRRSSRPCATSPSTAPITAPTRSGTPR